MGLESGSFYSATTLVIAAKIVHPNLTCPSRTTPPPPTSPNNDPNPPSLPAPPPTYPPRLHNPLPPPLLPLRPPPPNPRPLHPNPPSALHPPLLPPHLPLAPRALSILPTPAPVASSRSIARRRTPQGRNRRWTRSAASAHRGALDIRELFDRVGNGVFGAGYGCFVRGRAAGAWGAWGWWSDQ